jgi:hypothetical protein
MQLFREYVEYLSETAMKGMVGDKQSDRHASTYFTPDLLKNKYKLASKQHGLEAGSEITVHNISADGAHYHAQISHPSFKGNKTVRISSLHKPQNVAGVRTAATAEDIHLDYLKKQLHQAKEHTGKDEVTIRTHHGDIQAHSIEKVPGTPKADFVVKNKAGKHTYYISHKAGQTQRDYQQFGGISSHTEHPAVKEFAKHLQTHHSEGVSGKTVGMKLNLKNKSHNELAHKSIFGNKYSQEHGINNVHALMQGHVNITPHPEGHFTFTPTASVHFNTGTHKDVPHGMNLQIQARAGDRHQLGVKNTRVTINPVGASKTLHVKTGERLQ